MFNIYIYTYIYIYKNNLVSQVIFLFFYLSQVVVCLFVSWCFFAHSPFHLDTPCKFSWELMYYPFYKTS